MLLTKVVNQKHEAFRQWLGFRLVSLWSNVQDNLQSFINQNGGISSMYNPRSPHARPNWDDVKDFLEGKIDKSELRRRLGC